ncbi:trans-1,2-dihydrobenzene-1,2-diol dehydrogenase-like [Parasteatoda tepidariorum]|uniref:trans-1,2-dihydrobenzene-1,2-diol dehydrogenase-like n=1 Tax=Parasteatoda tepidariorum TaxID=114398 RepID=UPI001C71CC46|nr:trans-1,2-dihydrobenzene-1,2-diol dehydrogenase-like [Parasteatoda tepidariorum]
MTTNWGIVSASEITHDFVTAVQSIPEGGHNFVAVAARNLSAAEEFATNHHISKAYGSYEELANDSEIEIVYIGTITAHHYNVGKLMLEKGKHVLMEKPMTMNAKQTKALIGIAKREKRFLMEAIWSRFFPANKCLMELIKDEDIGDVVHVNVNMGLPFFERNRLMKKDMGRGTILDIGVYALNAVTTIYDGEKPSKIAAVGHLNEDGVDIAMNSSLLYSKNRTANVTTNAITQFPCDLVVIGTEGIIRVPNPFWCPTVVQTETETYEFPLPNTIRPCIYINSSGLRFEATHVRECIQKGMLESPVMTHKDSEILAEIMDEIRHQLGYYFEED